VECTLPTRPSPRRAAGSPSFSGTLIVELSGLFAGRRVIPYLGRSRTDGGRDTILWMAIWLLCSAGVLRTRSEFSGCWSGLPVWRGRAHLDAQPEQVSERSWKPVQVLHLVQPLPTATVQSLHGVAPAAAAGLSRFLARRLLLTARISTVCLMRPAQGLARSIHKPARPAQRVVRPHGQEAAPGGRHADQGCSTTVYGWELARHPRSGLP